MIRPENGVRTVSKKKKQTNALLRSENRTAYICLIPSIIGLIFLTYLPLLEVFGLSFFSWKGNNFQSFQWVGLKNYVKLLTTDPYFKESVLVTIQYTFMAVIGSMIYSLVIALLLNRKIPARGFWRAIFYLPYLLPAVAVYLGWNWLYNINYGLFNFIINRIFGLPRVGFVNDARLVGPSLALVSIWLAGNLIVIFLAGLQNVPRTYLEAAEVDGANSWQRFWNITVPCMSPIIFYNLLMALITNMQVITPALALTKGGPGNSSRFVSYVLYQYAFENRKYGLAAAVAVMLFVLISIFTAILFATSSSWMFSQGGDD
ncbi:MAG: sugar ABC transporter permease [Lachnospiraceae bacterium]|nr:sugar ABC transporter permease [Lachnospiraceae bacterium]